MVESAAMSLVLIASSTVVPSEAKVVVERPATPEVLRAAICVAVMLVPSASTCALVKAPISPVEIAFCCAVEKVPMTEAVNPGA